MRLHHEGKQITIISVSLWHLYKYEWYECAGTSPFQVKVKILFHFCLDCVKKFFKNDSDLSKKIYRFEKETDKIK